MDERELRYYAQVLDPDIKWLEFHILSDWHYGNPFCNTKRILRDRDYIKDTPNAFVIFIGDLCESAIKTSKGDIFRQVGTPQDQRDWCTEQLYPIRDKVLGMTGGNHEERIYQDVGMDITKDIAKELNCPYDPDGMYMKISFGNHNSRVSDRPFVYWIDAIHGHGGARTKSAKAMKVERQGYMVYADIHAMAHDHVVNVAPDVFLQPDNRTAPEKDENGNETGFMVGKVSAHRKMLIKTNAYLMWGGYARRKGFPPTDLVTPTIWLAGEEKPWPNAIKDDRPEVRIIV